MIEKKTNGEATVVPSETPATASFLKNPNQNTKEGVQTAKPANKRQPRPRGKANPPQAPSDAARGKKPKAPMTQAPKTPATQTPKAPATQAPKAPATQAHKAPMTQASKASTAQTKKQLGHPSQPKRAPKPHASSPVGTPIRRGQGKNRKTTGGTAVPLRIIPLGGLGEIGKNMTVYDCQGDMFIVDCGLAFPDSDMLGVDLVIPDFDFVEKNLSKIRGLVITHGHEDHIGSIPYLLKKFDIPIYASPLAIGLIKGKLKEHGLLGRAKLNVVSPRQIVKMGCMDVEFIHVNHSIPDAMAIAAHTPAGIVVQTGDFKIDYSPVEGGVADIARFAELGEEGVLALLSDSTNAERPGSTPSESKVGKAFEVLFGNADGKRIIIASFSSNIHRIQQIITIAGRFGRKVAVSGRSMENAVAVAMELGYLNVPAGVLVEMDAIGRYRSEQLIIITTGSQGEPMSALSRMASGDHRKMSVTAQDFIIISATPIPGNEKHVTRVVNDLLKLGAEVVYEAMYEVHVSGHACQDEQRMMLALTKPQYFLPVHGEYKHLRAHAKTAMALGIPEDHIHIGEIGEVLELSADKMVVAGAVEAGRVFVDGLGVGDVGAIVLRDRQHLALDGLIVVTMVMESSSGTLLAGPDIVSRGFVYVREAESLISDARQVVKNILAKCAEESIRDWSTIKLNVRDGLSNFIFKKTRRGPMILPIISEV